MNEVERFVEDIRIVSLDFAAAIEYARQLFFRLFPDLEEKIIYGGVGFLYKGTLIGGIYPNKRYLNLVFSRGNELNDPNALLLGKGKYRRHIRVTSVESLETVTVENLVLEYALLIQKPTG